MEAAQFFLFLELMLMTPRLERMERRRQCVLTDCKEVASMIFRPERIERERRSFETDNMS